MLEDSKKYIKNIASTRVETKIKYFKSSVVGKHGRKDMGMLEEPKSQQGVPKKTL
jgi:hypothetical protein